MFESSSSLEGIAVVLAGITTLISILLIAFRIFLNRAYSVSSGRKSAFESAEILETIKDATKSTNQLKHEHLDRRLKEVAESIKGYERDATINGFSNGLLVAGQYVVGGALASSFLQETLSNEIVGILGLVVLVATIFHQRFRPDVKSRTASEKAIYLRSRIRKVQDGLISDKPEIEKLIFLLSKALDKSEKDSEWITEDVDEISSEQNINEPI